MFEALAAIGEASMPALWFPVIAWSGLAALMMLTLGLARRLHPLAGYRLRQGILLALPASVVIAPWIPLPGFLRSTVPAALGGSLGTTFPLPAARVQLLADQVDVASILLGSATTAVMLLAVVRYLPAWHYLVQYFGNHGLWASLMIFLALRGLTLWVRIPALMRERFPANL